MAVARLACERCGRRGHEVCYSDALGIWTCLDCHGGRGGSVDQEGAAADSQISARPGPRSATASEEQPKKALEAKASQSLGAVLPRTSYLVPSVTFEQEVEGSGGEPEVEWLLREAAEGRLEPLPVELPSLPDGATQTMREVAAFFALVRGVRLWAGDGRDVPFACGWVAGKLGRPKKTVHRALRQLEACGVLVRGASLPPRGRRGTQLWAPGSLPSAAVAVEVRIEVVGDPVEPEPHLEDEALVGRAELAVADRPAATAGDRAGYGAPIGHAAHRTSPRN
jgi:hypothetical protein